MTPEQKELKVEAFRELLNNEDINCQISETDFPTWETKRASDLPATWWINPDILIRLGPPTEIPWHNPEGVTQEQLEPEKGWRFLTEDEVGSNNIPAAEWGHSTWGASTFSPTLKTYTYRTQSRLPEKYQHLVPESEEARARRLLLDVPQKEGYGPWEFVGVGPIAKTDGDVFIGLHFRDKPAAWISAYRNGNSDNMFYARARKLPTEKDKAEAALNAYKLEPGERLVHRGQYWNTEGRRRDYLFISKLTGAVIRHNNAIPQGEDRYYAEIIKEPELVPFTQETFPLGAWVRSKAGRLIQPLEISWDGIYAGSRYFSTDRQITFSELLEHGWEITTDSGATWARAGKGVEK